MTATSVVTPDAPAQTYEVEVISESSSTPLPFVSAPSSIAWPPFAQCAPDGSATTRTSSFALPTGAHTYEVDVTSLASSVPLPSPSLPVEIATPPPGQLAPGGSVDVETRPSGKIESPQAT